MDADKKAIRQFLDRVHGPEPEGWLIIWTRQDKATGAFDLGEKGVLDQVVEYCAAKATTFDVYAAVGLQQDKPSGNSRGAEQGVSVLPAFWADVDIAGPAHKALGLPPTEQDARSFICAGGQQPSVIVHSGFGLQPYWLFRKPWQIANEGERRRLKSLSIRFQSNLRVRANILNWTLDSTPDLCRVLRVPGTFNHKVAGDIRLVTAEYAEATYDLNDFENLLAGVEDPGDGGHESPPRSDLAPAHLPPILEGCVWMGHCRRDGATLSEPEWYRMITVIARCDEAERWAHELSRTHPKYSSRETQRKLKQASADKVAPVTCAYVQSDLNGEPFCRECLFRGNVKSPIAIGRIEGTKGELVPARSSKLTSTEKPPLHELPKPIGATAAKIEKFTDLGNARRFTARYRDTLLYCNAWNQWLLWDSMRWNPDERLEVIARAADLVRSLYAMAKNFTDDKEQKAFLRHVVRSESNRSLTAMVTLARADRAVAKHPHDFDTDPWLFNVMNGTLDLRTGELRSPDHKDLITKLAPVVYDASAQCPNWLEFLDMIMLGRTSLVEFLRRAFGSCLTGITSDKAMFILYGPGGDNGKSTLVEVFEMLLGDYSVRTPVETFLKRREGTIPNDIARLRGARFVWAAESDRGVRLAESLVKELTGGDRIAARFMRAEFFEFMPEFKVWLATNHKPVVRGDAAIWRRLKLVPFDYVIPKDRQKRRHEVMAMFRAELPGILNWAVSGCLEWRRDGLGVPEEVIIATRDYETEQDTFSMFLEEKCIRVPNARVLSLVVYRAYKSWAEEHGETPASHKTFASLMSERAFKKTKTSRGSLYSAIGMRTEEYDDGPRTGDKNVQQPPLAREDEGEEV